MMKKLGIRIGQSRRGRRHRKKAPSRLEKLYDAELLDAALKNPKALAVVIDKYGALPAVHHVDELEPKIDRIREKIQEKAIRAITKYRKRELLTRIDTFIDEVMGASNSRRRPYRKVTASDISASGWFNSPYITLRRQTMAAPIPVAFLEALEFIAFLAKLANQQVTAGAGGTTEKIHVAQEGDQMVEMSKKEYLGYLVKQYF